MDDRSIPQLALFYISATNEARDADQQIHSALESSVLNAQQNKVEKSRRSLFFDWHHFRRILD